MAIKMVLYSWHEQKWKNLNLKPEIATFFRRKTSR
jgi:hypothetical protein